MGHFKKDMDMEKEIVKIKYPTTPKEEKRLNETYSRGSWILSGDLIDSKPTKEEVNRNLKVALKCQN